jgi:HemX protein
VLVVHTLLLALLAVQYGRCPLWTQGEALLFLGWMLLLLHVLSEWSADTRRLGFFTLAPAALCGAASLFFLGDALELSPAYRSSWFIFHIVASLASYAAFSLAAVLAALYLIQHRKLKRKHFDRTFRRLPPLDKLDKLAAVWSFLGTLLMIASSVIGAWWVRRDALLGMSAQEAGIFVVLLIFLVAAVSRRALGWRGRRHALWVLAGFTALVLSNLWLHGFFRA